MANNSVVTQEVLQNTLERYHEDFVYPYQNGATHTGFTPVGTVISYFGETAPTHFLICDGTEYAKSDYPQLADLLLNLTDPTPFEGSDADHFKVPDLRGEFLRGTGTNSHANNGNGASVGVHQDATQHVGVTPFGGERSFAVAEVNNISGVNPDSVITGNNYRRKYTYSSSSDLNQPNYYTARPTNTSVLYCIAYKNIYIDLALDSFPLSISNPTDGQALVWNGTEGRWKNAGILHEYSTDEHVVGTWIDGKLIYERTIVNANLPAVSNWALLDDSVSYDKLFKCEYCIGSTFNGYWKNNDSQSVPRFSVQQSGDLQNKLCYYIDNTISSCIIIIQYTKTTD